MNAAALHWRQDNAHRLYPNQAAFAVQSFSITPTDVDEATSCPYETRAWQYASSDACPSGAVPTGAVNLKHDASCPWTYVDCTDTNRIPMTIKMAKCQCSDCLDPYTHAVDPNLRCQPVIYNMKVLRRSECINGFYRYVEETIPVPVACACMRQRRH